MKADLTASQSFNRNGNLRPVSAQSLPPIAGLEPIWMKSPVIAGAAREAGSALYEILGMTELIKVAYEKGEMESVQERLALLMSGAENLSTIITRVLDLSRLHAEPTTKASCCFNIVDLIREVTAQARPDIGHKPVKIIDLSSTAPVMIDSDPEKVRRIMTGLLSNAVKFTDRGRIAVILNHDQFRVTISITDTGRGMTAEQMNTAFTTTGSQGQEQNKNAEAAPGLRTIRNLVKLLEGGIIVSSKFGEGTIVEVTLPIAPAESLDDSSREIKKELPCVACSGLR